MANRCPAKAYIAAVYQIRWFLSMPAQNRVAEAEFADRKSNSSQNQIFSGSRREQLELELELKSSRVKLSGSHVSVSCKGGRK